MNHRDWEVLSWHAGCVFTLWKRRRRPHWPLGKPNCGKKNLKQCHPWFLLPINKNSFKENSKIKNKKKKQKMHKSNTETFTYDIGLATLWSSVFVWVRMCVRVSRDFISQASTKSVKVTHPKRNRRPSYFVILKHKCVYSVCPCISFYLMPRSELVPRKERGYSCVGGKNNQHNEFGSHFSIVTECGL